MNEQMSQRYKPPLPAIEIVTGSYPPDVCGVGDYCQQLVIHLTRWYDCHCEVFRPSCSLLLRWLGAWPVRGRVVIFQYPTAAYGASLLPHLFVMLARFLGLRVLVVLHEYSSLGLKARMASMLFGLFAHRLVFTTDYESASYAVFKHKHALIPIGSNIPQAQSVPVSRHYDCVYFGIIAPGKGIETFLSVASELCDKRFVLIGACSPLFIEYGQQVIAQARALGCSVHLGLPAEEVATLLSVSKVALLPFPDGISPRRGSALAAMLNGTLVVSMPPASHYTTMSEVCVCLRPDCSLSSQVAQILANLDTYQHTITRAMAFAAQAEWSEVCARFVELSGCPSENTGK